MNFYNLKTGDFESQLAEDIMSCIQVLSAPTEQARFFVKMSPRRTSKKDRARVEEALRALLCSYGLGNVQRANPIDVLTRCINLKPSEELAQYTAVLVNVLTTLHFLKHHDQEVIVELRERFLKSLMELYDYEIDPQTREQLAKPHRELVQQYPNLKDLDRDALYCLGVLNASAGASLTRNLPSVPEVIKMTLGFNGGNRIKRETFEGIAFRGMELTPKKNSSPFVLTLISAFQYLHLSEAKTSYPNYELRQQLYSHLVDYYEELSSNRRRMADEEIWRTLKNPHSSSDKSRRILIESTTGVILGGDVPTAMHGKKVDDKKAWAKLNSNTPETPAQKGTKRSTSGEEAPKARHNKIDQVSKKDPSEKTPQEMRDLPAFTPNISMEYPSVEWLSSHLNSANLYMTLAMQGLQVKKIDKTNGPIELRQTHLMRSVKLVVDNLQALPSSPSSPKLKAMTSKWCTGNSQFLRSLEPLGSTDLTESFETSGFANLLFHATTTIAADQLDEHTNGTVKEAILRTRKNYSAVGQNLLSCTLIFTKKIMSALTKKPPTLSREVVSQLSAYLPKEELDNGLNQLPRGLKELAIHVLNNVKIEIGTKGSNYKEGVLSLSDSKNSTIPHRIIFFHELGHAIDSFLCGGGLPSLGAMSGMIGRFEAELDELYLKKGYRPCLDVMTDCLEGDGNNAYFDPNVFNEKPSAWLELIIEGMVGKSSSELTDTFRQFNKVFPNEIVKVDQFKEIMLSKAKAFERLVVLHDALDALPELPEGTLRNFAGCASSHLITDYASGLISTSFTNIYTNHLQAGRFRDVTHGNGFWRAVPNEANGKVRTGSEMIAELIASLAQDPAGTNVLCHMFPKSLGSFLYKLCNF